MWRIYKEGQGKWGRGSLAFVIAIGSLFAVSSLHAALPQGPTLVIPGLNWSFDYRFLVEGPLLIAGLAVGVWLFNRPSTADFLIETENELKNKVTWPTRREEVNASVVVVVTVFILGVFILSIDFVLRSIQKLLFETGS